MTTRPNHPALPTCALLAAGALVIPQAVRASDRAWSFAVDADVEVRYDDNILSGSDEDITRIGNPLPGDEERFRVETPDDTILAPELRLAFEHARPRGLATDVSATLRGYDYQTNSVKDYQSYSLDLRQDLNHSREHGTALRLRAGFIPSYYLRELIDDDESAAAGAIVHHSLDYEKTELGLDLSQEIVHRRLSATVGYARERRDYNEHFNERDSDSDVISLDLSIYPLDTLAFRVRPYYAYESRTTRGDLPGTPVIDDDAGFDSSLLGADVRWRWGRDADHRNEISAWYDFEVRDFTTPYAVDASHYGREDDIQQVGLDYDREFGPHWKLYFAGKHRVNDSSHPDAAGGTLTTPYDKNVVGLGFRYSN